MTVEKSIVPLLEKHFPAFYAEEGPQFVEFVKKYYEWMEEEGNALYHSRRLQEYKDIDSAPEQFVEFFRKKYLYNVPLTSLRDKRLLFKHIKNFLASKGTTAGVELFFRLFFGDEASVYYPGDDLLRPSDGEFVIPIYLELSISPKTKNYVGKLITGVQSGATAVIEKLVRRGIGGKYFDVAYLSNIGGNFSTGELIVDDDTGDIRLAPQVIGSLTTLDITLTGASFAPGDTAKVVSQITGKGGLIRVIEVETATGRVTFTLVDGGWGFTEDALVYVSERTINDVDRINANTEINSFELFEDIEQPLATIDYINAPNAEIFEIGTFVVGVNTTSSNTGTGYSVGFTPDGANGTVKLIVHTGTFATASDLANTTANVAIITDFINSTATGLLMGQNASSVGLVSVGGVFTPNNFNFIRGLSSNTYSNIVSIATGTGARFDIGAIQDTETVFINTDFIGGNNVHGVPFLNIMLEGSASNTGIVSEIVVVSGGTGYTNGQLLVFSGGTPEIEANGTITTNGSGNVVSATVAVPGYGYDSEPIVTIDGAGSGAVLDPVMDWGYGFPKDPQADLLSIINTALSKNTFTIGEIVSLSNINPGSNYNQDPFVTIIEPFIAGFDRRDYVLDITNVVGTFIVGERLIQSLSLDTRTVVYNNLATSITDVLITSGGLDFDTTDTVSFSGGGGSGAAATLLIGTSLAITGVTGTFIFGESITQGANTGTFYFANSSVLLAIPTSGVFGTGLVTGDSSNASANATSATANAIIDIQITSGGGGYTSEPTVTINTSAGSGASLTAIRSGFIEGEPVAQGNSVGIINQISITNSIAGSLLLISDDTFAANSTPLNTELIAVDLATDAGPFVAGEKIIQIATNANGQVFFSNTTFIQVIDVGGTFDTSNVVVGQTSGQVANVSSVTPSVVDSISSNSTANVISSTPGVQLFTVKGNILTVAPTKLGIERRSFSVAFNPGPVEGQTSGATATVTGILQDSSSLPIGFNADVTGEAGTVTGSIKGFEVIDSGFAYEELENVTIEKEGSPFVASGFARLVTQGTGTGYFLSERGFLNVKFLHDNDYYQDYSYVVKTGLTLAKYTRILRDLLHVSGTKYFGELFKVTIAETPIHTLAVESGTIISNNSGTVLYED